MLATEFDPEGQVAALYSQLTGVLAGFAFTGLVLLLTRRLEERQSSGPPPQPAPPVEPAALPEPPLGWRRRVIRSVWPAFFDQAILREQQDAPAREGPTRQDQRDVKGQMPDALDSVFPPLLASFLGLSVTSLAYAVIAGEQSGVRTGIEHAVVGVGFAASALLLLMSIVTLLSEVASHVQSFAEALTTGWAPVLVLVYIVLGAYQAAESSMWQSFTVMNYLAVGTMAPPVLTALYRARRRRPEPLGPVGRKRVAAVAVGLALAASLCAPTISILTEADDSPFWPVVVALAVASAGASAFTWLGWSAPRKPTA